MSLTRFGISLVTLSALAIGLAAPARAQYQDGTQMFGGNYEKSGNKWQPFGPTGFEMDMEPFDIATFDDADGYDGADAFSEGWYFTYQRLNWTAGRPDKFPLGDPNPMRFTTGDGRVFLNQSNGRDVTVRGAPFTWGNRWEGGYWDGRTGWGASVLDLNDQLQSTLDVGLSINFQNPNVTFQLPPTNGVPGATVTITVLSGFVDADQDGFDDDLNGNGRFGRHIDTDGDGVPDQLAPTGPNAADQVDFEDTVIFPTQFDEVVTRNHTDTSGVELMKMFRFRPFHRGSVLELFAGARYLEVNDKFHVNAIGGFGNEFLNLGQGVDEAGNQVPIRVQSFWRSEVDNNIVGPQFGGRWYSRRGAFNFVAEARFLAGFNFQNVRQTGQLGGNIPVGVVNQGNNALNVLQNAPVAMDTSMFEHHARFEEFTPTGEVRVQWSYNVTKACALQLGWTGTYMNGIARASNMIVYRAPNLGISEHNREDFFTTGVDFGVTFNR